MRLLRDLRWIAVIAAALYLGRGSLAIPKYNLTQMYVRETVAIKAIQTIHRAQEQYESQYGRFATSLAELGPSAIGAPGPGAADLISNDLAQGQKQGYKFTVAGVPGGYQVHADPEVYGSSGSKSFYSDQTMVIRENDGPEPATQNSREYGVAAK